MTIKLGEAIWFLLMKFSMKTIKSHRFGNLLQPRLTERRERNKIKRKVFNFESLIKILQTLQLKSCRKFLKSALFLRI
jgi:hypothetical protein